MTDEQNQLTAILDDRQAIQALDKSQALLSAESFADQIQDVFNAEESFSLANLQLDQLENIVVAGMGGSALGADVILHLYESELKIPLTISRSYQLPAFVNEKTLVILSSYSGSTEETLACEEQAAVAHAQIVVVTAGGELLERAKKKAYPFFQIVPKHNPSQQPRLAVGYSIMAQILILKKAGLLKFTQEDLDDVLTIIHQTTENCLVEVPQEKNQAKLLALMALERRPILVGAEFLEGALHVSTNQFNENAKSFADYKVLPEMNHHLLEGLQFPKSNSMNHFFIFFQSQLYLARNQKRLLLTQELVEQREIESIRVDLKAESKVTQVFEAITLGCFANLYLAFLEKIDPSPIPSVDWFKEQMKKA